MLKSARPTAAQAQPASSQQSEYWVSVQNYTVSSTPALSGNNLAGIVLTDDGRAILPIAGSNTINILSADRRTVQTITTPTEAYGLGGTFGGNNFAYWNHKIFYTGDGGQKVYVYDENSGQSIRIADRRNYYWGMAVNESWILLPAVNPGGAGTSIDVYNNSVNINAITLTKRFTQNCSGVSVTCIPLDAYFLAVGDLNMTYPSKAYIVGNYAYFIRGSSGATQPDGGFYKINLSTNQVATYTSANIVGLNSSWPIDMHYDSLTDEIYFSKIYPSPELDRINPSLSSASLFNTESLFIWASTPNFLLTSDVIANVSGYKTLHNVRTINKNTGVELVFSLTSSIPILSSSIVAVVYRADTNEVYIATPSGLSVLTGAPPTPFLDLPALYTSFSVAANGNYGGSNSGRVNSWFDHNPAGQTVTNWTGNPITGAAQTDVNTCATYDRAGCYDGHNGIDFSHDTLQDSIFAAANGTVFGVVSNCQSNSSGCTGYGNRVWVNHGNGYATLYGHLSIVSITNGTVITDRLAQSLGFMGSTGNSRGIHLHFGLYYDQNGDGQWSESETVDPYGNQGASYLWIHPLSDQQQMSSSGGSISAPSGNSTVTVPVNALSSPVTLELWDTPSVAGATATLRSTGNSFWMRVLEWLTGGSSPALMTSAATNSFDLPVTVTVHYDPSWMPHLAINQLTINQWDDVGLAWVALPTTLDTLNQQASAQTSQPGYFDLQAPLVCPADALEPNDNYDGASVVQTNGMLVSNLFDIAQDQDWFQFNAITGRKYSIQTKNLAAGVDTVLEIYDTDGVTVLASDDNSGGENASSLTWQAPQNGLYFLRVSRATGSNYGCNAIYQLGVVQWQRLFLPLIVR